MFDGRYCVTDPFASAPYLGDDVVVTVWSFGENDFCAVTVFQVSFVGSILAYYVAEEVEGDVGCAVWFGVW